MTVSNFASVAERLFPGARLLSVRRLTGGVSADVHALELDCADGRRRTVVVRQHGSAQWKPRIEQVAAMEYELLKVLYSAGLPVPEPLLLDTSDQLSAAPCLVMAFVEGTTDVPAGQLNACLEVMAATLSHLHNLPIEDLPALPSRLDPIPEIVEYLPDFPESRALRRYLSRDADSTYQDEPVLLHGDFWPGNLLWRDGELVAILDWEDAALGDPLSDVAGCRIELLWKYGAEAMSYFTQLYMKDRSVDARRLALWEVCAGSAANHFRGEWGLEPSYEAEMRRKTNGFIRAAAAALLGEN